MKSAQASNIALFIQMERSAAELYRLFHESFPEDAPFWWEISIEEENHAALLRAERENFLEKGLVPEEVFHATADELEKTCSAIRQIIQAHKREAFSRATALQTALAVETMAGEIHFQKLIEMQPESRGLRIFQTLNQDDRDHARRIEAYMKTQGLA